MTKLEKKEKAIEIYQERIYAIRKEIKQQTRIGFKYKGRDEK